MDIPEICLPVVILLILMAISSFCRFLKTALLENHKSHLAELTDDFAPPYDRLENLIDFSDGLTTALTAVTACCRLSWGILVGFFIIPYANCLWQKDDVPFSYSTYFIFTACSLLFLLFDLLLNVYLPKKIAQIKPEEYLVKYSTLLLQLNTVIVPLFGFFSYCTNLFLMVIGINMHRSENVTEEEVKDLIEKGTEEGTFEKTEQDMVDRIFHMSDQTAYALMTPRTQLAWIDLEDDLKTNLELIKKENESIFLAGNGSLDEFSGIIYARELLRAFIDHDNIELVKFIHKPMFIPRSMKTFDILEKFRSNDVHEAIVVDEYGGIVGLITLSDITDEIIGDIAIDDEDENLPIIQRDENSWYVDGLCSVDDFKERFDIEFLPGEKKGHYQTMGGFLMSYFGYIPHTSEKKDWENFSFEVADMDRNRIDKILLTVN